MAKTELELAQEQLNEELQIDVTKTADAPADFDSVMGEVAKGVNELRVHLGFQPLLLPEFGQDGEVLKDIGGTAYEPTIFTNEGTGYRDAEDIKKDIVGGDTATEELLDAVPVIKSLMDGVTGQLEIIHGEIAANRELQTAVLKSNQLVMAGLLALARRDREFNTELVKSLDSIPTYQPSQGILAMLRTGNGTSTTAGQTSDSAINKNQGGTAAETQFSPDIPDNGELMLVVKSVLEKPVDQRTAGEKKLNVEHMENAGRRGPSSLPPAFLQERGWVLPSTQ